MLKGECILSNNYYDEILAQIRQAVREEDYQEAARLLEFEHAAFLRDKIRELQSS